MYLTNTLDSTFITIITKYKIDHVNLAYILFSMLGLHLFFYASILQVQAVLISELKQKLTPHTTHTQTRTHSVQARSTLIPKDTRGWEVLEDHQTPSVPDTAPWPFWSIRAWGCKENWGKSPCENLCWAALERGRWVLHRACPTNRASGSFALGLASDNRLMIQFVMLMHLIFSWSIVGLSYPAVHTSNMLVRCSQMHVVILIYTTTTATIENVRLAQW